MWKDKHSFPTAGRSQKSLSPLDFTDEGWKLRKCLQTRRGCRREDECQLVMLMGALRMELIKEGSLRCPGKKSPSSFYKPSLWLKHYIILSFLKTNSWLAGRNEGLLLDNPVCQLDPWEGFGEGLLFFLIDVRMGMCVFVWSLQQRVWWETDCDLLPRPSGLVLAGELWVGEAQKRLRAVSVVLQGPPYGFSWPGPGLEAAVNLSPCPPTRPMEASATGVYGCCHWGQCWISPKKKIAHVQGQRINPNRMVEGWNHV